MKKLSILLVAAVTTIAFSLSSCSDAQMAAFNGLGHKRKVRLFSGGQCVGEWVTSGKIENEHGSNGYFFNNDATGKLVEIDGTVIIETM